MRLASLNKNSTSRWASENSQTFQICNLYSCVVKQATAFFWTKVWEPVHIYQMGLHKTYLNNLEHVSQDF